MGKRKAYNKDIIKNIIVQKISWISIIMIAAIAAAAYFGISLTADALAENADRYYTKLNIADLKIESTLFFTDEDAEAIAAVEGVSDVEKLWTVSGCIKGSEDELLDVSVLSLSERISLPNLLEGRLPENENECIIQSDIQTGANYNVGDTIIIKGKDKDKPDFLKNGSFKIVGIMNHPDIIFSSAKTSRRYIIVPYEAFDTNNDFTKGCFTTLLVDVDHKADKSFFADKNMDETEAVSQKINEIAGTREKLRESSVNDFLASKEKEVDDGEKKVADAKKQLTDAKKKLTDAKKQLKDGRKQLDDIKKQLDDGKKKLDEGKAMLDSGWATAKSGKTQLDSGKAQLDAGKVQLAQTYAQLEDAKNQIRNKLRESLGRMGEGVNWSNGRPNPDIDSSDVSAKTFYITEDYSIQLGTPIKTIIYNFIKGRFPDDVLWEIYEEKTGLPRVEGVDPAELLATLIAESPQVKNSEGDYQKLSDGAAEWDRMHNDVYLPGLYTYYSKLNEYNQGIALLNQKQAQYEDALAKYNSGLIQYEEGEKKYADGVKQYEDGEAKYEDGKKQFEEKVAEFDEAKKTFNDFKALINRIDGCRWINESLKVNVDYMTTRLNVNNFRLISYTFSALFILVGMVVIYATVGRIIDEQQKQVGSMKAFGFTEYEVFHKYLMFALTSTVIGSILGIIAGATLIQYIGLSQTFKYSNMGKNTFAFNMLAAVIFTILSGLLGSLAVYLSCRKLLKKHATELLGGFAPVSGLKKASKGRKGSLFNKLIWRNMWIDKKRVAITVISVAGATALLVIGFTVRYCINNSVKKQFEDITLYDETLKVEETISDDDRARIEEILNDSGVEYVKVRMKTVTFMGAEDYDSTTLITFNPEDLKRYYNLHELSDSRLINLEDGGIYVPKKTCEVMKLESGKNITFFTEYMKSFDVPVNGSYVTYIDRFFVCTDKTFMDYFGTKTPFNTYLIYMNGNDPESLKSRLKEIDGFGGLQNFDSVKEQYMSYVRAFDFVMMILTVIAGMMVFFILNNLVNMYVNQKRKEISIMRINGYTIREMERYLLNELVITISAGMVLGAAVGVAFGGYISYMLEQPVFMLVRSPQAMAIILGILITSVFTSIVLFFAIRRAKNFRLVDAMD